MTRFWGLAREVVAQRLLIVGVVTAVLHLAVAMHWVSQGWSDDAIKQVTGLLDALGAVVAGVVIRRVVTPSKDPKDVDGEPLMRVDEHIAALTAATAVPEPVEFVDAPAEDVTPHPLPYPPHVPEHAAPTNTDQGA